MPHLVTNRPRVANPAQTDPDHSSHDGWERLSSAVYVLGGMTFVAGSIFFLPALSAWQYIGAWLFFVGSLLYALVTGHDLFEVVWFWRLFFSRTLARVLELSASASYVTGSLLFAVGSLFFLPGWDWPIPGAWCFIIGSAAFVVGANVNLLQVVEAPTLVYLELFNLTVAGFAVGSALFFVASVPFLWHLQSDQDSQLLFTYVAWEYTGGSLIFLTGGVLIHFRHVMRRAMIAIGQPRTSMLSQFIRGEIHDYGPLSTKSDDA